MRAQVPKVGFIARKACAVNAGLLPRAHSDRLSVFNIANGVGLGVFKRDKRNNKVAFRAFGQVFVFGHDI